MQRHTQSMSRSHTVVAKPTPSYCQVNIGTKKKPRTCGEKMTKENEYTYICRRHGEMH